MRNRLAQLSDDELDALIAMKQQGAHPGGISNPSMSEAIASGAEAFGRGALEGATLGYAPKVIGAAGEFALPYIRPDLFGDKKDNEIYKELRDTAREQQRQSAEKHPYVNLAGNLAGAAVLPFPVKTVKGAAKLGAAYGAAQSLGSNDTGEVGSLSADDILGSAYGGITGGAIGAGVQGIANKVFPKRAKPSAESQERLKLSKELGVPITKGEATGKHTELLREEAALRGRLGPTNQENMREFREVRTQDFKNAASRARANIGGEEFVSKGAAASDVVNKIQQEAKDTREAYSQLYKEATKNVTKVDTTDLKSFPEMIMADLEEKVITADNAPRTFGEIKTLSQIVKGDEISLNKLEAWKQGLNRIMQEAPRGGQEEFALKQLSKGFDGYLDGIIEKALIEGDSTALQKFKDARKLTAEWYAKYEAKNDSEFGKKFIEDIVDNMRFSREPYSDEMLVNKILGTSELGFKPESAAIVQELKKQVGPADFKKIKLEAANKLLAPLFAETPNVVTYKNNLRRLVEGNPTLAKELFSSDELMQFEKLGTLGQALFTRQKSMMNPSGTADVLIDFIAKKSGFGWLKEAVSNFFTRKIPLEQDAVRKAVEAGEKLPRQLSTRHKAYMLGAQGSIIEDLANKEKFDGLSDAQLDSLIEKKRQIENPTFDLTSSTENKEKQPVTEDTGLIDKIATVESGNNPNARSRTSSASGLLQFTNGTWKDAVRRYGAETGISLQDKNNPEAQKIMASLMLQDNGRELQQFLGRRPNDTELYLTHFLGLDGAKKLLKHIGTGHSAAKLLPEAARANREIFFANGRPRTVEELYGVISRKV